MDFLNRVRRAVRRVGLDVRRVSEVDEWRLAKLLNQARIESIVDVGANHGQFALGLRRAGYAGWIRSIEPLPQAFEALSKAAARDPRWSVECVALGASAGTEELNVSGNSHAASSSFAPMLTRHKVAAPEARYVAKVPVPVRTLDALMAESGEESSGRILLKLDVQGYEREVLRGAHASLPRLDGLQMELSLVPLYEGGMSLSEGLDFARDQGFDPALVIPGFSDHRTGETLQVDVVFLRRPLGMIAEL